MAVQSCFAVPLSPAAEPGWRQGCCRRRILCEHSCGVADDASVVGGVDVGAGALFEHLSVLGAESFSEPHDDADGAGSAGGELSVGDAFVEGAGVEGFDGFTEEVGLTLAFAGVVAVVEVRAGDEKGGVAGFGAFEFADGVVDVLGEAVFTGVVEAAEDEGGDFEAFFHEGLDEGNLDFEGVFHDVDGVVEFDEGRSADERFAEGAVDRRGAEGRVV